MEKLVDYLNPNIGSVYKHAWDTMKKYFLPMFLLLLISGVVSIPAGILNNHQTIKFQQFHDIENWRVMFGENHFEYSAGAVLLKIFGIAYTLFIINPIAYGVKFMKLRAVRRENFDVKEVFLVFKNYLNVILAALLTTSIVVIGFIFLIIPGIIFACRLYFVPYLVMDKNLDPIKAVEESWRLTKGYGWKIFLMAIVAFFIAIAGLICLIFGIIISIIWVSLAFAAMYQAVIQKKMQLETINDQNAGTV